MPPRVKSGLAFWMPTDINFAVGLVTERSSRYGPLVWMAEQTFEEVPDLAAVRQIALWRWPVFFLLGPAMSRGYAVPIGVIEVPPKLSGYPRMRGTLLRHGWKEVEFSDGSSPPTVGAFTTDYSLPVHAIVNEARLKTMIETNYRSETDI